MDFRCLWSSILVFMIGTGSIVVGSRRTFVHRMSFHNPTSRTASARWANRTLSSSPPTIAVLIERACLKPASSIWGRPNHFGSTVTTAFPIGLTVRVWMYDAIATNGVVDWVLVAHFHEFKPDVDFFLKQKQDWCDYGVEACCATWLRVRQ